MSFDRVLAELVSAARRAGLEVSPVEAMDAQRAAMGVGLSSKADLRAALRAVLVKRAEGLETFERTFEAFFAADGRAQGGLYDRLESSGFARDEVETLRSLVEAMGQQFGGGGGGSGGGLGAVLEGGAELDRLLFAAGRSVSLDRMQTPMQTGFYTSRLLEAAGLPDMQSDLAALRAALRGALGERGDALADAIARELEQLRRTARTHVEADFRRRNASIYEELRNRRLAERSFTQLAPDEVERVSREVRRLADKLRRAESVRRKRRRRGTLDVRRTLRASHATSGVPFRPVFRKRRRERPKLIVVCDISDSVRFAARFLLLFVYSVQEVFARTRTFVFVSELGETTELFKAHPPERALQLAYSGAVISVASNSNYGHALGVFRERFLDHVVDRRTTVLVVGDARTNYFDPNVAALVAVRRRAGRVLWMNPEPKGAWGFGDSAMDAYAPECHSVMTVHNLETLRAAVDRLVRER